MTRSPRFLSITTSNSSVEAQPPESPNIESDLVVILAALLCALICVVGLIAVLRCAWLRHTTRTPPQATANKGLKKKVVQSIPKFSYSTSTTIPTLQQGSECAICLAEFTDGDEIRVLPHCSHTFHVCCIDTWLASHSSCPSCRQILAVARCQKCGHFPAMSSSASAITGAQAKATEDDAVVANSNSSSHNSHTYLP